MTGSKAIADEGPAADAAQALSPVAEQPHSFVPVPLITALPTGTPVKNPFPGFHDCLIFLLPGSLVVTL